jgi:imidazolonepropionase-like amidohydrolase
LLTSEEFEEKRKNIGKIPLGSIGLNPELVPIIVRKAHAAGLRVSAHIDTATDFRIALKAGVDEMAHLPGYYVTLEDKFEKYLLTDDDAKEAARRKIWTIPAPVVYGSIEPKIREKTDVVLKHNLNLMKKYRVQVAFGSDSYGRTPVEDVLYLNKIGVFNNLETLKIWSEDTPRTIFPKRKIGKLKDDFEASFIVLEKNPLENFENTRTIWFRFKQGFVLNP